ncbi:MAG: hypothetical protein NVSMB6_26330 [Burkholderiaceae bacterium]
MQSNFFEPGFHPSRFHVAFVILSILGLFSIAFLRTAWVTEDAFITFRTVDNALSGLGLTWNPGERVQTYTHPLWFGLLLTGIAIFNDAYYVSLALSYALLIITLLALIRVAGGWRLSTA